MTQLFGSVLCCGLWFVAVASALPEDPSEYLAWETAMIEAVKVQSSSPPELAIPKLGEWVRKLDAVSTAHREREGRPVFRAAQKALLAIPGHAEYYAKRIKDARQKVDDASPGEKGALWNPLQEEQMYGFQTLQQLTSPETIRVLGEFLYDERGLFPKDELEQEIARNRGELSNAEWALPTLAAMPLTYKPVQPREYKDFTVYDEDINAWRLWYEQIKAGTRTFRFEGDPQEYSLAGPVAEARVPASSAARPAAGVDASRTGAEEDKPLPVIPLVVASVLLALALWQSTRRRSGRAAKG